jgi:endonuclease YncB( thermonuclease family)
MRYLLGLCALLVLCVSAHATEITGQVVAVSEGDTLVFQDRNQRDYKVRLAGIDAPEILQAFGRKSRFSLKDMVFLKPARLVGIAPAPDDAGVTLARVFVGDTDVGLAQVARGMAWARGADGQPYETAEQSARAQRKGLWRDDAPTPPWLWRCC